MARIASRRTLLAGAALLAAPRLARAAAWPDRPVRWVVGYAPGGNADLVARTVAPALSERLGQPVIVENRAGAGGSVAATALARARWDGASIMIGSNGPLTVNPVVQANLGYDPLRDFLPVGLIVRTPLAFAVNRAQPMRDLAALIATAKADPGRLAFGTPGVASTGHLTLEMFNATAGTEITHAPYTGGGALVADLVSGTLAGACVEISTLLPLARDGAVRLLAVTAERRARATPEVPTCTEAGLPGFTAASFIGVVAPAGAPPEVIATLSRALAAVTADSAIREKLEQTGSEVAPAGDATPEGFAAFIRREAAWTRTAAEKAKIRPS